MVSTWQELRESDDAVMFRRGAVHAETDSARCWPDKTAKRLCEAAGLMSQWNQPCRSPCTHVTFPVSLLTAGLANTIPGGRGGGGGDRHRERSVDSQFKLSVFT